MKYVKTKIQKYILTFSFCLLVCTKTLNVLVTISVEKQKYGTQFTENELETW